MATTRASTRCRHASRAGCAGRTDPCRLVAIHQPASLQPVIDETIATVTQTDDHWRVNRLAGYRQHYEALARGGDFQTARCGLAVWTEEASPDALAMAAAGAFGTPVYESAWPPLLRGRYEIRTAPFAHLAPVGHPGGRSFAVFLTSYELHPVEWSFFRPLGDLFAQGFPIAVCVDIPHTWRRPLRAHALKG